MFKGDNKTHIVNASLTSHFVPDSWKLTVVHPIRKSSKSNDFSCFRPISILTTIGKITERVVFEQLYSYFSSHHLFTPRQHGFRPNHSTDTALLTLTDHVFSAMDARQITLLCLIDCSRCFDCIPHDRLLRKLELYGIDTRWFESYLSNHYQQVQIQNSNIRQGFEQSGPLLNPLGTFQGSALGPLLYTIYANDLPLYSDTASTVMYADDCQVYLSGPPRDLGQIISSMENSLSLLATWYNKNGLKINSAKTQLLVLGSRQIVKRLPPISLTFMGSTLTCSESAKNLGVWFDQNMTFSAHIDDVVRRCTGLLCGLSHCKHSLPQFALIAIVQGLVLPVIRYCLTVFGTSCVTQGN